MVVHSVLPDSLAAAVAEELRAAGVAHVPHTGEPPLRAAEAAAAAGDAAALIGPFRRPTSPRRSRRPRRRACR